MHEGWPQGWFSRSTSGGEPWIFCVTDMFIAHCFAMIDQILDGVRNFVRLEYGPEAPADGA